MHPRLTATALLLLVVPLVLLTSTLSPAAPPSGFVVQQIGGTWNEVAGVVFIEDGRSIAWERGGRLWMIDADGTRHASPMLDLSAEVGAWRDHGLLGVALHPSFLSNGRIYLLYMVDRHHLLNFGTAQYNPNANEFFAASVGRITRYTATAASNFSQVDPDSRLVLLGESPSTGIPLVHQSHGVGTILFGSDGTLLVSVGDNASYESNDFGGQVSGGYVTQALADGILAPRENVGAFRSQLVDSLCGKILRLDPATGDGVPSNPFFDASAPRSPRSRVWALGLRNPFRMEIIPGTGSHHPPAGDPGRLIIGDVGWNWREELNICDAPGLNFGWPVFEGLDWLNAYALNGTANPDAPNPLFGQGGTPSCTSPSFAFRDLLIHDTPESSPLFPNPCGLFQAESATIVGPVIVTDVPGYTGTGYVDYQNASGDFIQWSVPIASTGPHTLHFRYALGAGGNRPLRITVDGVQVAAAQPFPSTGSWSRNEWSTLTVPMAAGTRLIRATATGSSGPNIDALAVLPAGEPITEIPASVPRFVHQRPVIDFLHGGGQAFVPGFSGSVPTALLVGSTESGVAGVPFQGFCAIGGSRVEAGNWPQEWHGAYLFGDFSSAFIRAVKLDALGAVNEVKVFDSSAGAVILARYRAMDDSLWITRWGTRLLRIRHAPGTNQPPVAAWSATPPYGPSPLEVTLDASASYDPEGTALAFTWVLPDGTPPVDGAVVKHTFSGDGPQRHDVQLVVRDAGGLEVSVKVPIWTDNTPPAVTILSPVDGQLYPMDRKSVLPLHASISDAEHDDLDCAWVTVLHHNSHAHAEPIDPACSTTAVITPLGCGDETYFYEVQLTVTDPLGLATWANAFIHPDCKGVLLCPADLNRDGRVDGSDLGELLGQWGATGAHLHADLDGSGLVDGADLGDLLGAWGPCP